MSNVQIKRESAKSQQNKKLDFIYYIAAATAVILVLVYIPGLLAKSGAAFLSSESGLNKLLSVVVASVAAWVCVSPAQSYKGFIELAKGARTEWRKTVRPDRDTVTKTTMMVLGLVVIFALMILVLDWVFGSMLRGFVN